MPSVITAPLFMKFLIDLAAPCCVCPTPHSPALANMILLIIILQESRTRVPSIKVMMIYMTTMIVQLAMMLTMTENCVRDTSDSNESSSSFLRGSTSTHGDSKVFLNGLNGHKFYYNSSQDKIGFIPHNTHDIPVPPQFQIPSSCQLSRSPHELELMLFISRNFLSPSIFDKVMKWAHSATAKGYKFNSPSYSTLKKQMNYTFPNTINGGTLKSMVAFLPDEVGSDLPVTMWYFEDSFGVVCKVPLRSSSHEGL
jgi:hypothetical protein